MTLFDHSAGSVGESAPVVSLHNSEVLLKVCNHTYTSDNAKTMTDNSNGKSLKVISSTDSTSASRSNLGRDQLSKDKNDQKVYLSGKTLGKKIISDVDTYLKQCLENPTLWIAFDRHIIPMTDKAC